MTSCAPAIVWTAHGFVQCFAPAKHCVSYPRALFNVLRVDAVGYSTAKLADVEDRYYYGVSRQSRKCAAQISLTKLRISLGGDYRLVKRRAVAEVPHQAVGNVAHLFN